MHTCIAKFIYDKVTTEVTNYDKLKDTVCDCPPPFKELQKERLQSEVQAEVQMQGRRRSIHGHGRCLRQPRATALRLQQARCRAKELDEKNPRYINKASPGLY